MEIKNNSILKNVLLYLLLLIIVSGGIFSEQLSSLDELWNYNAARCIQDGLLPYRDISIITIPLFPIICSVFLKILGNELIVMRILSCLVFAGILFVIYKILTRLKVNKSLSLILSLGLAWYYIKLKIYSLEYNWASLFVQLILLFLELKNTERPLESKVIKELLLGILARKYNFI